MFAGPDALVTARDWEIARLVLLQLPLSMHEKPKHIRVLTSMFVEDEAFDDDHETDVVLYLDGSSHQSGKQRAWTCCRNAAHTRCFKYVFVHKYENRRAAFIWLASWVVLGQKPNMRKYGLSGHLKLLITPENLEGVAGFVPEDI